MKGTGTVNLGSSIPAGTNAIGKLAANSGVDIGDVDVTSLPAANLGQKAMAASLSVVPASDITDTTYIGDIKFGEALPAGTNNIGDVDVLTLPSSIQGAGNPTVDSYNVAAISAAAATANQSLIAAPGASKQIWVYGIQFSADTGAGSASFQDEDDTAITGVMPFAENGGMAVTPSGNFSMPLWKVATNKALEVDTLVCGIKGSIQYAIVSV